MSQIWRSDKPSDLQNRKPIIRPSKAILWARIKNYENTNQKRTHRGRRL